MTRETDPELVRRALLSLDYPADKQEVVRHAAGAGAEEAVTRVLSALPLGTYDNLDEILRSIPRDPAEGEELSTTSRQGGPRLRP
ncbi:DUF2795 domain-containing protein [Planomonospora sp. ID67723]|uniref:DUF2795 domain-containing protein n=1 Tax=Planomonospora sp. ID67723 TaxID=2738134 RepID=UPI0018C42171|nr:DUF2795 domain-containing protein [Planomonospora sp. ID67723]MBG0827239.1 DUF2795 domain-containing protein [Planomonospora sp. ID67723]